MTGVTVAAESVAGRGRYTWHATATVESWSAAAAGNTWQAAPVTSPATPEQVPRIAGVAVNLPARPHPQGCVGTPDAEEHAIMRTDLIRKTALTAAGLAFTGGAIAGPVTTAYAASDAKPTSQTQTDRKPSGERELGVRYEAQPNFYYCGPAATRNALSVQGKNINVDDMAKEMGTTEAGTNSITDITPVL
ncbi:C39 family peptidase, partial [Micromonospora sp. NPDC048839]|uniref:C39 family peptidase n=1 Tax=Micromonospora sp. NPDC048839 TaxID=3155641 RepID=UPI00340262B8